MPLHFREEDSKTEKVSSKGRESISHREVLFIRYIFPYQNPMTKVLILIIFLLLNWLQVRITSRTKLSVQPMLDEVMTLFYIFHAQIWILSKFSLQIGETGKKATKKEESDEEEEEEEENENEENEAEVDENEQGVNGTSTNSTDVENGNGSSGGDNGEEEGEEESVPDAEGTTVAGEQDNGRFEPTTLQQEVYGTTPPPLGETTTTEYEGEYEQTGTNEYDNGYEVYENENREPRGDNYRAYEDEYSYYKGHSYDSYDGQNYYYPH